jgi:hypothetical protein
LFGRHSDGGAFNANLISERAHNPPRKYSNNNDDLDDSWRGWLEGEARMSQALVENLDFVQRIDGLTALAEARRSDVMREIDRHRATLGKRSRPAVQQVEGEYKVIGERPRQHPAEGGEAA